MEQYTKIAQACQLRTKIMPEVFKGNPTAASITGGKAIRTIQWGSDVFIVANFDPAAAKETTLPDGTWYDYFAAATTPTANKTITLNAGEVKIFTGKQQQLPDIKQSFDFLLSLPNTQNSYHDNPTPTCKKILINGEILIQRGNLIYDLNGRRRL